MFTFEFIKTFVKQHLNSVPDFGWQKLTSQRRTLKYKVNKQKLNKETKGKSTYYIEFGNLEAWSQMKIGQLHI